ncbi:MAG: 4Fe-4S binding protein [Candidatus Omnitrophota bacterium]|nr:4Fe-4S binding protein [Candidatus Omnitrophota bacterium]
MSAYKGFEKNRSFNQFWMSLVFLAVIIWGWFYPLLGFFIPACMLLGVGIALKKGRKWCDWYCPRGSFYDCMIKPVSPKKGIPSVFKNTYVRIGVLVFLMVVMAVNLIKRWSSIDRIGMFFVIILTVTTVLGIILALFFHQRSWCCVCPIGTLSNWVGRGKKELRIDSKLCTECRLCFKVCPIQIAPNKFKKDKIEVMADSDCLKCGLCVTACPTSALSMDDG